MIILLFIVAIGIFYCILVRLNNLALFQPDYKYWNVRDFSAIYRAFEKTHAVDINPEIYIDSEGAKIHAILFRNFMQNKIFIYAHGNGGNISRVYRDPVVLLLVSYGSVIVFDYRGYGCSTGTPSENGIKTDTLMIWNYIVDLGYRPENIILYGVSLGSSCVSWLAQHLITSVPSIRPYGMIMQSGFYSLQKLVGELVHPVARYFLTNGFNNAVYLTTIRERDPEFPILLLHSKTDGLIGYSHSSDLAKETNCEICEIFGSHNNPIFGTHVSRHINDFLGHRSFDE